MIILLLKIQKTPYLVHRFFMSHNNSAAHTLSLVLQKLPRALSYYQETKGCEGQMLPRATRVILAINISQKSLYKQGTFDNSDNYFECPHSSVK